jgi:hypothetical protein
VTSGTDRLTKASLADLSGGRRPLDLVTRSRAQLDAAAARAHSSLPLRPLRPLPVVGTQVRAVDDLTAASARVGRRAEVAATPIQRRLDEGVGDGPGRLALIGTVREQLTTLRPALDQEKGRLGANGWLVPPLRDAREHAVDRLQTLDTKLADAGASADALDRLLRGPSTYLVLAANNAEMRAGGIPASVGVATFSGGDVKIGGFVGAETYRIQGEGIALPPDLAAVWGRQFPIERDIRPLATSPNFPEVAPLYRDIVARSGVHVDGVIQLDVLALQAILGVTGPVEVEGRTIQQTQVRTLLMFENYLEFKTDDERDARLALQSKLGVAAFDAVTSRRIPLPDLARALLEAAKGRHVLAWSADGRAEALWQLAHVDGALDPVGLMVNVRNMSANKLDFFIRPQVETSVRSLHGGARRITLSITVTNPRREVTSPAVEGEAYARDNGITVGSHRVLVNAYLPLAAHDITTGDKALDVQGRDGPMQVAGVRHLLALGETKVFTIAFTVPAEVFDIHLLPSARGFPVPFRWKGQVRDDATGSTLKVH